MRVQHTADVVAYLRELADQIASMDEPIPAGTCDVEVMVHLFRRENDGHTNRKAMEFCDRYAQATGYKPPVADLNCYRTGGTTYGGIILYHLKEPKVKPPLIDPDI